MSIDHDFCDRMDHILGHDGYAHVLESKLAKSFEGTVKVYYGRHVPVENGDDLAYYIKVVVKQDSAGEGAEQFHLTIAKARWPQVHFTDFTGQHEAQWWYVFDHEKGLLLHSDHAQQDVPLHIRNIKPLCDEIITAARPN